MVAGGGGVAAEGFRAAQPGSATGRSHGAGRRRGAAAGGGGAVTAVRGEWR